MKKFIELLRRGTAEARDSAIDCLRTVLAPCALDAYPVLTDSLFYALFFSFCVIVMVSPPPKQVLPNLYQLILEMALRGSAILNFYCSHSTFEFV